MLLAFPITFNFIPASFEHTGGIDLFISFM